jgi:hypothetical protein
MSELPGDEWKRTPTPIVTTDYDRPRKQRNLDTDYALGRITKRQWSAGTDALSMVDSDGAPFFDVREGS